MDSWRRYLIPPALAAVLTSSVLAQASRFPVTRVSGDAPSSPTAARSGKPPKIGFVDMDIVLKESRSVQEQIGKIEDQLDSRKKEIDRLAAEYNRLKDGLERQDSVLTDDEKVKRRKRIQELKTEIEDKQYEANKHLRQSERGVVEPVLDAVMETLRQLGEREGFDLILRGELVLYGSPVIDLTDRFIAELDSKVLVLPSVPDGSGTKTRPGDSSTTPTSTPRSRAPGKPESLPLVP